MSLETSRKAVDFTFAHSQAQAGLGFFGGEPLLARELLYQTHGYALAQASSSGKKLCCSIATNGSLLTEADADWLATNAFFVQLSLDGSGPMHSVHRLFPNGQSSYGHALLALKRLQSRPIELEVVTVLTPNNVQYLGASLQELIFTHNVRRIALNLSYRSPWSPKAQAQLEQALHDAAQHVIRAYQQGIAPIIDLFDEKIESHIEGGYQSHQYCRFGCGKVAIDVDGTLYPCDRIAGDGKQKAFRIGHLELGLDEQKAKRLWQEVGMRKAGCLTCKIQSRCRHWCGCINAECSGKLDTVSDFFCFAERLKVRYADEIAKTLYAQRNECFLIRFYG